MDFIVFAINDEMIYSKHFQNTGWSLHYSVMQPNQKLGVETRRIKASSHEESFINLNMSSSLK